MKRLILSFWFLIIVMELSSQSYHFDSIPDNLKRGADAVVRTDQCLFTLLKPGKATLRIKRAVTLLNDFTSQYRHLSVDYNSFSRVKYLKGAIYDEKGKIIKILGLLDIQDMSAVTGGSFYSDDRMKYMYFPIYKYPYTIEYEYEIEYSSLINYPAWNFQDSRDVSVERSGIQIIVPENMKLRYYDNYLKNDVDSVVTGNEKIYTWQEENIPANPEREFFLPEEVNLPVLYPAPLDFEFGGYTGSMDSWNSFGAWVYNLIKDRDKISEPELTKVSEIVSGAKDQREKVRLIYEYVQSKTRYVSIDIGIGGFQPSEASEVASNGFGDCKALVNYTKGLLQAVGINSYYTLVNAGNTAGDKEFNANFVDNHFNHIILCVPMQNDSVWLECTSQTSPFNYLGTFTNDRNVLLITPEGGKLVKTPSFSQDENILKRTGSVFINTLGASTEKIVNQYSGSYFDIASSSYSKDSEEEIKRKLSATLGFSDFTLTDASYNEIKTEKPVAHLSYNLFVNDFALLAGKRFFFNPSLSLQDYLQDQPAAMEISEHQIYADSVSYVLPGGYHVENLPHSVNFDSEFGRYNYQLEVKNDRIIYQRYLRINKGIIPVSKFQELRKFINSIAQTDRQRISLSKNIL